MPQFKDKTVLITGASSGIGAALAAEFFRHGAKVWLFARREDRLKELCHTIDPTGNRVHWVVGNVTDPLSLSSAVKTIHDRGETLDVVIANAGMAVVGAFETLTEDDYRRQLEVNTFGVLNSLRATVSDLKKVAGRFVIVSSINGYVSVPGASAYSMSKFALQAFADSVRHELAPSGVSITIVCPGFVQSEIRRVNNAGHFEPGVKDFIPLWLQMPARTAAKKIRFAAYLRVPERILTIHGWGIVTLKRHVPWLVRFLFRFLKVRARPEVTTSASRHASSG